MYWTCKPIILVSVLPQKIYDHVVISLELLHTGHRHLLPHILQLKLHAPGLQKAVVHGILLNHREMKFKFHLTAGGHLVYSTLWALLSLMGNLYFVLALHNRQHVSIPVWCEGSVIFPRGSREAVLMNNQIIYLLQVSLAWEVWSTIEYAKKCHVWEILHQLLCHNFYFLL